MRKAKLIWIILTGTLLVSCAGIGINKPKGQISIIHSLELPAGVAPYRNQFDFEKDFDDYGRLLPNAKGVKVPLLGIPELDKGVFLDAASYVRLNAVKKKLVQRLKQCQEQ